MWRAVLDTWPGLVWLARHGLLVLLGAFLALRADVAARRNWIAARGQALLLAALALGLRERLRSRRGRHAGHGRRRWRSTPCIFWARASGPARSVPLALLLRAARREAGADASRLRGRAARRFSRAALITMLVLLGSGVASARCRWRASRASPGTAHGRLLLAKLALLVADPGPGRRESPRVLPRGGAAGGPADEPPGRGVSPRSSALEAGLALVLRRAGRGDDGDDPGTPRGSRLAVAAPAVARRSPRRSTGATARADGRPAGPGRRRGLAVASACAPPPRPRAGRRRRPVASGAGVALPPLVVDAYPTTYRRPLVTYHAGLDRRGAWPSTGALRRLPRSPGPGQAMTTAARPISARPDLGSPAGRAVLADHPRQARARDAGLRTRLGEAARWHVINFIRALDAAEATRGRIGPARSSSSAPWLVAPDFTITVGPVDAAGAARLSRPADGPARAVRAAGIARSPGGAGAELRHAVDPRRRDRCRAATGVAPMRSASSARRPPILFPVVTDGNADIMATYHLFTPGSAHAEFLIDRQGYIRAIWRTEAGGIRRRPRCRRRSSGSTPSRARRRSPTITSTEEPGGPGHAGMAGRHDPESRPGGRRRHGLRRLGAPSGRPGPGSECGQGAGRAARARASGLRGGRACRRAAVGGTGCRARRLPAAARGHPRGDPGPAPGEDDGLPRGAPGEPRPSRWARPLLAEGTDADDAVLVALVPGERPHRGVHAATVSPRVAASGPGPNAGSNPASSQSRQRGSSE